MLLEVVLDLELRGLDRRGVEEGSPLSVIHESLDLLLLVWMAQGSGNKC